jgi:phage-related protein
MAKGGNEVEIVVTSKDQTGPGLSGASESMSRFSRATRGSGRTADEAGTKIKSYGDHVDRVAERADNSERNLIGLHDVVDGTATIMAGPGKAGIVAYIQGWADLAGGLAPLIPMMKNLSKEVITNTINSIRNGAVQTALAVKTKAMAAAQWLLNAAMSANPIALVIIAIAALIAIIVVAYKRSETFRRIVQSAFAAVRSAANTLRSGVVGAFHGLVAGGSAVISFFRGLPGRITGFIKGLPGTLYHLGSEIIHSFVNGMKAVGGAIVSALSSLIPGPIKSFLHLGSPAKQGPMSEDGGPEHWGEKVSTFFGKGLARGARGIPGVLGGIAPGAGATGGGRGGAIVLEIHSGGTHLDDLLVEVLRKAIGTRGGDVQVVLGR